MKDGVYIRFSDIRPALEHASKKQIAALFLAILDYAEKGTEPKAPRQYDPVYTWVFKAFPFWKAKIDGEDEDDGTKKNVLS